MPKSLISLIFSNYIYQCYTSTLFSRFLHTVIKTLFLTILLAKKNLLSKCLCNFIINLAILLDIYNISLYFNTALVIIIVIIIIVCIFACIFLLSIAYKYRVLLSLAYIFNCGVFLLSVDNLFINYLIIILSFLSLYVSLTKTYKSNNIDYLLNIIINPLYLISYIITVIVVCLFRYGLLDILNVDFSPLLGFSLIMPTIIIFRSLNNIIFIIICCNVVITPYYMLILLITHLIKKDTYYIKNGISIITLILFAFNPFIFAITYILGIDIQYTWSNTQYTWSDCNRNVDASKFIALCPLEGNFDKSSVPRGEFKDPLIAKLNFDHAKTYDYLKSENYDDVYIDTGKGKVKGTILKKEITEAGNTSTVEWYKTYGEYFFKKSYLKTMFTKNIELFYSDNTKFNYSNEVKGSYVTNEGVFEQYKELKLYPTHEDKVDGITTNLMMNYFGNNRGFSYNPQSKDDSVTSLANKAGKVDFLIKYKGEIVLMVEDKTLVGDSWLDLIEQANRYCKKFCVTSCFVLLLRGTKMSSFIYSLDFHSDNNLDLKHAYYDDFIALEVNKDGIEPMQQHNTWYPQLKIYESDYFTSKDYSTHKVPNNSDVFSTHSLLTFISNYKKMNGVKFNPESKKISLSIGDDKVPERTVAHCGIGLAREVTLNKEGGFNYLSRVMSS